MGQRKTGKEKEMGQRKKGKEKEIAGSEKDRGRKRWDRERKGKRKRKMGQRKTGGGAVCSVSEKTTEEETARGFGGDYCMFYTFFCSFLYGPLCPRSC